jgi:ribonucleotide monophosphatase NagD (HAD superfamily)
MARGLREDGLPVGDEEMLTPVESAITYLQVRHPGAPLLLFGTRAIHERLSDAGITLAEDEEAEVVFVAHPSEISLDALERAARAVTRGAPLFTGSYVRGYAGANGLIFSRGAMTTAAIAKAGGVRPRVLGKPSRPAVAEVAGRLGVPSSSIAVIGDDLGMDIALGRLGGSRTVLVRSGVSGQIDLSKVPERRRPDAAIDGVADLLDGLDS